MVGWAFQFGCNFTAGLPEEVRCPIVNLHIQPCLASLAASRMEVGWLWGAVCWNCSSVGGQGRHPGALSPWAPVMGMSQAHALHPLLAGLKPVIHSSAWAWYPSFQPA